MNSENQSNANQILDFINQNFESQSSTSVLDVCCGVYSESISYDPNGIIYQPLVAQLLSQGGYEVLGLDFRQSQKPVSFNLRTDVNILENDWVQKINQKFDVVIFLRSWDTPEILLDFQARLKIYDVNKLTLNIAEFLVPKFQNLINKNGVFITTNIISPDLEIDNNVYQEQLEKLENLFITNNLTLIKEVDGLLYFCKN